MHNCKRPFSRCTVAQTHRAAHWLSVHPRYQDWLRRTAAMESFILGSVPPEFSHNLPPGWNTVLSYLSRTRCSDVICYLDFDGVLHHESVYRRPGIGVYMDQRAAPGHRLFEWAEHLVEMLDPYPDVAIVLSTSWVSVLSFSEARARLPRSLAARVIGATYHSKVHGLSHETREHFDSMSRGEQVYADVKRRRPAKWFAIDDDVDDWPQCILGHLVACNGCRGLDDEQSRRDLALMLSRIHHVT